MKTFADAQTLMARETAEQRIDLHDPLQLKHWSRTFKIGTDVLQELVMMCGPSASRIRKFLQQHRTHTL